MSDKLNLMNKMFRSTAPSRRRSREQANRLRRDREYRPGRSDTITDDFAVIPRVPEENFRPHRRYSPQPPYYVRSDPYDDQSIEWEYMLPEDLPVPVNEEPRPATPTDGYKGSKVGMVRCNDCKSWFSRAKLEHGKCEDCIKVIEADRVNNKNDKFPRHPSEAPQ